MNDGLFPVDFRKRGLQDRFNEAAESGIDFLACERLRLRKMCVDNRDKKFPRRMVLSGFDKECPKSAERVS